MDYYQLLGVSRTATAAEIKAAYHKLAFKYHPDRNPDPKIAFHFKEITEAYNTIGDPENRKVYDLRYSSVFQEIFAQEPVDLTKDPKFRRKRPANAPPVKKKPTHKQLLKQYLPKVLWINAAGAFFIVVIVMDFFLPVMEREEMVMKIVSVESARGVYQHELVVTDKNTKLKFSPEEWRNFSDHADIYIKATPIFSTIRYISNAPETFTLERFGIYGPPGIIPCVLLITSVLGLLFRDRIEFAFNLSIVSSVLLFISLYLIFVL